jgi:hypothetical protein
MCDESFPKYSHRTEERKLEASATVVSEPAVELTKTQLRGIS